MDPSAKTAIGVTVACTAVTTGLTAWLLARKAHDAFGRNHNGYNETISGEIYSDRDGTATSETVAQYSAGVQKLATIFGSIAGTALAIATAARAAVAGSSLETLVVDWLFVLSWCCIVVNSVLLFRERKYTKSFDHAILLFWIILAVLTAQATVVWVLFKQGAGKWFVGLGSGQIGAACITLTSVLLIPRRPAVYHKGKDVDGMLTVSLLSRYSFYWAGFVLERAVKKGRFDEKDIPGMDAGRRAEVLLEEFYNIQKSPKLYMHMLKAHWPALARVWAVSVVGTIVTFTPPLVMNRVLKAIEKQDAGLNVGITGYYWVVVLGLIKILESFMVSYIFWNCFSYIMIPMRSQLSAIVFGKTMRKKDVKGSQKEEDDKASTISGGSDDEGDELKNLKQGTINLLAVDSERVSLFCGFTNIFIESFVGTIYGFVYIVVVLGWQALLAGIAVVVLTTPINIYFSKRYATAQDDLMKVRDKKMAVLSEALQGIRQIKFSALEGKWEDRIGEVREEELGALRRSYMADTGLISVWIINPLFLSVAALSVYAIINGQLTASIAFPALAIFGELEWTLSIVPELVTDAMDALVSIKRIERYMNSPEKDKYTVDSERIAMVDATVAWAADSEDEATKDRFCLRNLNLNFPLKELSIISGRTGSGKSLLLNSLLGESDLLGGKVEMPAPPKTEERFDSKAHPSNWIIPNAVAFVAQIPWIENGTVRDNIIFGLPFNERRYRKTLDACALTKDLESLTDGELTEIGVNGINLSGGQRWRMSFARAVYSRAGILILDDIFSAVDVHVGKHIFENGLTGELMAGRTRILVTHHIKLCASQAKYAVILANGMVDTAGSVSELQERGVLDRIIAKVEEGQDEAEEQIYEEDITLTRTITRESARSHAPHDRSIDAPTSHGPPKPRQFIQDEEREQGSVKWTFYRSYLKASGGYWVWVFILLMFVCQAGLILARGYWVKVWTSSGHETVSATANHMIFQYPFQRLKMVYQDESTRSLSYWIGMYVLISVASCIVGVFRYAYLFLRSIVASRRMFNRLLYTVLRTPLRWLDTVPTGRIMNRFSKDFETTDSNLANDIAFFLWNGLGLVGINVAAIYLSPYIIIVAIVGLGVSVQYAIYYLAGAREVKRLESNARSPIFELFGATLSGVATIRAFGRAQEYVDKMYEKINTHSQRTFYVWLFNRWVGLRFSLIGAVFATVVGIFVIAIPGIDAPMAGFALSFALNYTNNVTWTLRRYANVELDMNSTERIVEYSEVEIEDQGGQDPPAAWPTEGRIEVNDLQISYAHDLPPVLKDISFDVKPRERVGIVGRTGAGKSSLTLALFRFVPALNGTIYIDGIDTSKVKLKELRGRLAIIPQDPVLFSGTIRSNLDPFGEHGDASLLDAMCRAHLTGSSTGGSETSSSIVDENTNIFNNLDSRVSEGGLNLSQGQRQLLCLARAIVARPKILVLDEATSAVDMETDALIQKSIREEFTDCTTLVIAHRLSTVMDYDRILVLGDGKVLEYDTPKALIQKKGHFYDMVQQTGESEQLEEEAMQKVDEQRSVP